MNVIFADTLVSLSDEVRTIIVQTGPPDFRFTDEEFERYCAEHTDLRIEVDSDGEMIIQLPVVTEDGGRNFHLTGRFYAWVEKDNTGRISWSNCARNLIASRRCGTRWKSIWPTAPSLAG